MTNNTFFWQIEKFWGCHRLDMLRWFPYGLRILDISYRFRNTGGAPENWRNHTNQLKNRLCYLSDCSIILFHIRPFLFRCCRSTVLDPGADMLFKNGVARIIFLVIFQTFLSIINIRLCIVIVFKLYFTPCQDILAVQVRVAVPKAPFQNIFANIRIKGEAKRHVQAHKNRIFVGVAEFFRGGAPLSLANFKETH